MKNKDNAALDMADFVAEKRRLYDDKSELKYLDEFFATEKQDEKYLPRQSMEQQNKYPIEPPAKEKKKLRRFPSGAVRSDDTGRPRPDYISPYAIMALGEHFGGTNENDFGATNYYLGIKPVDCLGSMMRHYCELAIAIHQNDKEAIRSAVKAFAANGIMALHQVEIERLGLYKEIYEQTEII